MIKTAVPANHHGVSRPPRRRTVDLGGVAARLAVVALPLFLAASGSHAEPTSTLNGMWRLLGDCAQSVGGPADSVGSEVTVLFSIRRDGSLQGQPRITHAKLVGDEAAQRAFLAGVLASMARCFPLAITEGLGGAVAGRPLRLRLMNRPRQRGASHLATPGLERSGRLEAVPTHVAIGNGSRLPSAERDRWAGIEPARRRMTAASPA